MSLCHLDHPMLWFRVRGILPCCGVASHATIRLDTNRCVFKVNSPTNLSTCSEFRTTILLVEKNNRKTQSICILTNRHVVPGSGPVETLPRPGAWACAVKWCGTRPAQQPFPGRAGKSTREGSHNLRKPVRVGRPLPEEMSLGIGR